MSASIYFTYQKNRWKKVDAFGGIPIKELNDGLLLNTLNGFGIYYPKDYKLFTEKEGFLFPNAFIPSLFSDSNGIELIDTRNDHLFAFIRYSESASIMIICNFDESSSDM